MGCVYVLEGFDRVIDQELQVQMGDLYQLKYTWPGSLDYLATVTVDLGLPYLAKLAAALLDWFCIPITAWDTARVKSVEWE